MKVLSALILEWYAVSRSDINCQSYGYPKWANSDNSETTLFL